jgi:hypothetical protein
MIRMIYFSNIRRYSYHVNLGSHHYRAELKETPSGVRQYSVKFSECVELPLIDFVTAEGGAGSPHQ